jgi:hypothetical protein
LLKGFPDAAKTKPKTPRPGGGLRTRWRDAKNGRIYEWDYQHGRVEVYDGRGQHLGDFDPETGRQVSGPKPTRRVTP